MPPSFDFGAVFAPGVRIEVYMPAVFDELRDWGNTMAVVSRHRPDITADATRSAIRRRPRASGARAAPPAAAQARYSVVLRPFRESIVDTMRRPVLTIWAAVGVVLLIGCINLANLLLVRGATRRREMALRSAIGGGRGRLVRQLMAESVIRRSPAAGSVSQWPMARSTTCAGSKGSASRCSSMRRSTPWHSVWPLGSAC